MGRFWRKFGWALCLVGLLAACSKVPDEILSQQKMRAVLKDMLLAESMVYVDNQKFRSDTMKQALYESVFRKHGIDQALYDSSLVWYGKNLDLYMKVYERVQRDIEKDINNLGDVQAKATIATVNMDSVNIWPRREYVEFSPRSLFTGVTFLVQPEMRYSSGSSFVLRMNVWGVNKDKGLVPEIRIYADQVDTTIVVNDRVLTDGFHQTVVKTVPTKNIRKVYGYIRMNNADSTYYKVFMDNLKLIKYKYGRGNL